MTRVCKCCNKYVCKDKMNVCGSCYNKLSEERKKDIEVERNEKKGIFKNTLEGWI